MESRHKVKSRLIDDRHRSKTHTKIHRRNLQNRIAHSSMTYSCVGVLGKNDGDQTGGRKRQLEGREKSGDESSQAKELNQSNCTCGCVLVYFNAFEQPLKS